MLISDSPGIDWRAVYRNRAEALNYTPQQIADIPIVQMLALWNEDEGGEPDRPGVIVNPSRTQQLELMNRLRARKGLPPIEPQGWKPEAAANG